MTPRDPLPHPPEAELALGLRTQGPGGHLCPRCGYPLREGTVTGESPGPLRVFKCPCCGSIYLRRDLPGEPSLAMPSPNEIRLSP